MRTDKTLADMLSEIWRRYFVDIRQVNPVTVKFGRKAKNSLGSIRMNKKTRSSIININGLLALPEVPDYVVTAVLAHELVHYAHGFNSEHEKQQRYPHLGGVITKELGWRGLGETTQLQKKWIKANWREFVARQRAS